MKIGNEQHKVGFTASLNYYEILKELIFDMLDCSKGNDIAGALEGLTELYLVTFPFIEKHIDKGFDDFDIIEKQLESILDETTDIIAKKNRKSILIAKKELNKKKRTLYVAMAKAGLFVHLVADTSSRPAALATDDL